MLPSLQRLSELLETTSNQAETLRHQVERCNDARYEDSFSALLIILSANKMHGGSDRRIRIQTPQEKGA